MEVHHTAPPTVEASLWLGDLGTAATLGDCARLRELLASAPPGVSVDAPSEGGMTALMWAASLARVEACELLLQAGANPDARSGFGFSPVCVGGYRGGDSDGRSQRGAELMAAYGGDLARAPRRYEVRMTDGPAPPDDRARRARQKIERPLRERLGLGVQWLEGYETGVIWARPEELATLQVACGGCDPTEVVRFEVCEAPPKGEGL